MRVQYKSSVLFRFAENPFFEDLQRLVEGPFSLPGSKLPRILVSRICKSLKPVLNSVFGVHVIFKIGRSRKSGFVPAETFPTPNIHLATKRLHRAVLHLSGCPHGHQKSKASMKGMIYLQCSFRPRGGRVGRSRVGASSSPPSARLGALSPVFLAAITVTHHTSYLSQPIFFFKPHTF